MKVTEVNNKYTTKLMVN